MQHALPAESAELIFGVAICIWFCRYLWHDVVHDYRIFRICSRLRPLLRLTEGMGLPVAFFAVLTGPGTVDVGRGTV